MSEHQRMAKYEQEIARLDVLYEHLNQLWEKVPLFFWPAALAPLVFYFAGWGWALVELLITGALVGCQAYLISMRKSENRWNREQVAEDLARLKQQLAQSLER
jgi:hypothetical protein